ncbi:hypothetical protein IT411_00315, partial [Candidatus Peregrinibacteria bacterium]|nr:hypothetical protein [Candidatus Peregrinibacteria bacterium]
MSKRLLGLLLAASVSLTVFGAGIANAEEKSLDEGFEAEPEASSYIPGDDIGHPVDPAEKEVLLKIDDIEVKWSDLDLSSGQSALMSSMSVNNDPQVSGLVNSDLTSFLKNLQGNYKTDLFSGAATFYYPLW